MNYSMPGFPVFHYLPVCANSCLLFWWCYPTISSSVTYFSSCPQSFPASGCFPMNWLFPSGGQSIRALASVLLMKIQVWFPLRLTGLNSLVSKGLSRGFSSTTIWKHQFLNAQPSLQSNLLKDVLCLAAQSCPIVYNLMACNPPGSSIHGIL